MDKITYFGGDKKVKENNWPDYCKSSNNGFDEKEYSHADQFSWPPRHYTCTFCRRNFKSAQALGGHMNVHRRDRAMLRQPPSWVLQLPNNTNPNSKSSPKKTGFQHSSVSSSSSSSLSSSSSTSLSHLPPQPSYNNIYVKPKSLMMPPYLVTKHGFASSGLKEFGKEGDEFKVMKNGLIGNRLDLALGLVRNKDREDLDLELRLGYSTI